MPAQADGGDTIVVKPGPNAIQDAVDEADAGDTIRIRRGVYRESVLVTKELTIRGAGWRAGGTVIRPPAGAPNGECEGAGICVFGEFDATGNVVDTVEDVRISGLSANGFEAFGIIAVGADDLTVTHVRARDNGEYGIGAFASSDTTFAYTRTSGSGEAGLYMGDSPDAGNSMHHNVATHNMLGLFMRDSTDIEAEHNRVVRNCVGVLALDTGAPTAAGEFDIEQNRVARNNLACPAGEEAPDLSGIGVLLLGTHDVEVSDNTVLRNRPTGPTIASGGIVLMSGSFAGGGELTDNTVEDNVVRRNREFDLFWDETGSGNVIEDNECATSSPGGLCE